MLRPLENLAAVAAMTNNVGAIEEQLGDLQEAGCEI